MNIFFPIEITISRQTSVVVTFKHEHAYNITPSSKPWQYTSWYGDQSFFSGHDDDKHLNWGGTNI